jgi:hypothetical protein
LNPLTHRCVIPSQIITLKMQKIYLPMNLKDLPISSTEKLITECT